MRFLYKKPSYSNHKKNKIHFYYPFKPHTPKTCLKQFLITLEKKQRCRSYCHFSCRRFYHLNISWNAINYSLLTGENIFIVFLPFLDCLWWKECLKRCQYEFSSNFRRLARGRVGRRQQKNIKLKDQISGGCKKTLDALKTLAEIKLVSSRISARMLFPRRAKWINSFEMFSRTFWADENSNWKITLNDLLKIMEMNLSSGSFETSFQKSSQNWRSNFSSKISHFSQIFMNVHLGRLHSSGLDYASQFFRKFEQKI